jgi:nucleotide-binding universal stress UspA family protein
VTDRPFSDIVVPLDGSPAAERALAPAIALVRRTGAPVRVLSRVLADDKEELTAYLAGVARRYDEITDVDTEVVDRESIPDAIVDGLRPDSLVCLSSHGRGGLRRATLGSITEALLRTIDRPALVVGPRAVRASFAGRVVAALDGSRESERVVAPAIAWATMLGEPLWLAEVCQRDHRADVGDTVDAGWLAAVARAAGVDGWDTLHDRTAAHGLVGLAASRVTPTGLLVLATHGRTGWSRLRLGSVTAATIHDAPVPVLVVPGRHGGQGTAGPGDG